MVRAEETRGRETDGRKSGVVGGAKEGSVLETCPVCKKGKEELDERNSRVELTAKEPFRKGVGETI